MIKKSVFSVLIILIAAIMFFQSNKKSKIEVGDKVPVFSLKDQDGNNFNISDYIGKKALVIYFYPKDDTPGCTKEACTFRDEFAQFRDLNAKIIGISGDDVESHKKFVEKYNLPFTLLADTKNEVRKLFGVPKSMGLIPGRVTYIVDLKGKVVHIFDSMSNAEMHIEEALNSLNKIPNN